MPALSIFSCFAHFSLHSSASDSRIDSHGMVPPQDRHASNAPPMHPPHIDVLKEELQKARFLQDEFTGTPCQPHYDAKAFTAQASLDAALTKWQTELSEAEEKRRRELRASYSLGCFGDPEDIRNLLFAASSAVLDSHDLRELTFSINSFTGKGAD